MRQFFQSFLVIFLALSVVQLSAQQVFTLQEGVSQPYLATQVKVDFAALKQVLADLQSEGATTIELPTPNAEFETFSLEISETMHPDLALRYPEIMAMKGKASSGALLRMEMGHLGLQVYVWHPEEGVYLITPTSNNDIYGEYLLYRKKDFVHPNGQVESTPFSCGTSADNSQFILPAKSFGTKKSSKTATADPLRRYRLAVSATGQYTQFFGGVPQALSAIVTSVNRVNGIYEREFSITMTLIANNDQLIFTNGSTDPFDDSDNSALLSQNQSTINGIIGSANYDIGHVFSRIGGGIASLGSVCSGNRKAMGVTGRSQPLGDPFDVDYVAHEMGHQFGGNHTQNNQCNRNSSTAFEPGSGSTIMGYAGICAPNLQNNSDDYFHAGNYDEIMGFTLQGNGFNCAATQTPNNSAPTVSPARSFFNIPVGTPFFLMAEGSDPDNDVITYCWEQMDLGPSTAPNNPTGSAPMFRSFSPSLSSTRFLPTKVGVITGSPVTGENLPSYGRSLNFRVSVRDNKLGGGAQSFEEINVTVDDQMGPFEVTAPTLGQAFERGSAIAVEWDAAGTDQGFCQTVHILLSPDQGITWTDTLLKNTPNDGGENVVLPNVSYPNPKIIVVAADQFFYNMSKAFILTNPSNTLNGPINLVAAKSGADAILGWDDMSNNETGFVIERMAVGSGNFEVIDTVVGNITNYIDATPDFSTVLRYRVYAYNTVAVSGTSNEEDINAVGQEELDIEPIRVFPNPASESLYLSGIPNSGGLLKIFDLNGRLLMEATLLANQLEPIAVSHLSKGWYQIQIITPNQTHSQPFIKK